MDFWKIHSQNWVDICSKKGCFLTENFFWKTLRKFFYRSYDHVQYIWKVVQDHIFTLEKELESYDTSNELYGRKRKKVWIFEKSTLRIGLRHASKMHVFRVKFFPNALEKFSTHRMTMFKVLERLSKTISLRSKKN